MVRGCLFSFVILILSGLFPIQPARAESPGFGPQIVVSCPDQAMALVENGKLLTKYRISTSKFGMGDQFGSWKTPSGNLWVCHKIGFNLPLGAVIKGRAPTGEILAPNAKGRDPIVTRVIWLSGMEQKNHNAFARCIYIHGTTEEKKLGKPASFGCIRMSSKDVADLYEKIRVGTHVIIENKPLASLVNQGALRTASASN